MSIMQREVLIIDTSGNYKYISFVYGLKSELYQLLAKLRSIVPSLKQSICDHKKSEKDAIRRKFVDEVEQSSSIICICILSNILIHAKYLQKMFKMPKEKAKRTAFISTMQKLSGVRAKYRIIPAEIHIDRELEIFKAVIQSFFPHSKIITKTELIILADILANINLRKPRMIKYKKRFIEIR